MQSQRQRSPGEADLSLRSALNGTAQQRHERPLRGAVAEPLTMLDFVGNNYPGVEEEKSKRKRQKKNGRYKRNKGGRVRTS